MITGFSLEPKLVDKHLSTFPMHINFQFSCIYIISSNVLFPIIDQEDSENETGRVQFEFVHYFCLYISLKKDRNPKMICGLQCRYYFILVKTCSNFHHDTKLRCTKYAIFRNFHPISSLWFPNTITFFKDNLSKFHDANNSCELLGFSENGCTI